MSWPTLREDYLYLLQLINHDIVFLGIKNGRSIIQEFFLPVANKVGSNLMLTGELVDFFFTTDSLQYNVGFKFGTICSFFIDNNLLSFADFSISDSSSFE